MRATGFWLVLCLITTACGKWSGVDDLVRSLECGMNESAIRSVASKFSGLEVGPSNDAAFGDVVAFKSGTKVWMDLDDQGGLVSVIYSWEDGIASAAYSLKQNLCTRQAYVVLRIGGPSQLGNGTVFLDGQPVDRLSPQIAVADIDVPLGAHEVRVEKCGFQPWSASVSYERDAEGYDVLRIPALPEDPTTNCAGATAADLRMRSVVASAMERESETRRGGGAQQAKAAHGRE